MNNRNLFILLIHLLLFFITYFVLYKLNVIPGIPSNKNIIQWDAKWYVSIKDTGYVYLPNRDCNMAFFPLFPLVWKITFLRGLGISVFNLLLFIVSFLFLLGKKQFPTPDMLMLFSIPSFIFFSLPYSESLFFFFGMLLLTGMERKNKVWIITGLVGCSLSWSVSVIFIPALIINRFLHHGGNKKKNKIAAIDAVIHIVVCLISILLVIWIQGLQTGKWFYFFSMHQYWKGHFILPGIPFTTFLPELNLAMDATALLLGVLATFYCVRWGIKHILRHYHLNDIPLSVSFSALFLAGVTTINIFFTFNIHGHANIWSLSRHLLCTPFAVFFLIWFWKQYRTDSNDIFVLYGILCLLIFVSGVYQYFIPLIYFTLFSVFYLIRKFGSMTFCMGKGNKV